MARTALAALVSAAIAGCASSGAEAHSGHDRSIDFSRYASFAMKQAEVEQPYDKPGYTAEEERGLERTIARALDAKGYRETAEAAADLLVSVVVEARVRPEVVEPGYSPGLEDVPRTGELYVITDARGTVVIKMYDRSTKQRVWHGWAGSDLFADSYDADEGERLTRAIMALYPPPPDPLWTPVSDER